MNPMSIMAQAEKLGIPELQRSIQNGVVPAFIGVPLLQEKVKRQKQMQMGMAAQQPKRPSVAEQVGQEAQQATIADIMKAQALRMQGEMGQTGGISDSLPKPEGYAKGGPIAFAERGLVPEPSYSRFGTGLTDTSLGFPNTPEYEDLVRRYGRSEVAKRIAQNLYQGTVGTYVQGAKDFGSRVKGYAESMRDVPEALADITGWYGTENDPRNSVRGIDVTDPQAQVVKPQVVALQNQPAVNVIDRRAPVAQPVTENILNKNALNRQTPDVDQAQAMQDRIVTRKAPPVMGGTAPTQTQTPYAQAAVPATQTQPAQEEEKDLTLAERMKEYRDATGENKGIDALRGRLSEREARLAKEESRAPWMALMQAGLSTMAGTSPNALTNIGQGGAAGLQAYAHSMNKLEDAKDKSFEIQAKLEEAQRGEELAAAKYGLDSVQVDKKAKATAKLEREKMAHDFKIHELDNAARLQIENIQAGATLGAANIRADMYGGAGAGAGKPVKLTDQQRYYSNMEDAMAADPNYRRDLRLPNGQPDPAKLAIEYRKTFKDVQNEALFGGMGMGGNMGTSSGAGGAGGAGSDILARYGIGS